MPRERKNSSHAVSILRFVTIVFPLLPRPDRLLSFGKDETLLLGGLATLTERSSSLLRFTGQSVRKDSSSDPRKSTGLQFFCSQIFMVRVSTGDGPQRPLILLNHALFSGSSALQPFSQNSTIDPSLCFHLNIKLIGMGFSRYVRENA
jgi:hypothetical protein